MKNLILLMFSIALFSCAEKPLDVEQAKVVVEELIKQSDAGNYDELEKLYSPAFNASEPIEVKKEKLEQLKSVLGVMQSYEFLKSSHVAEFGQPKKMLMEYRVIHSRVTTIEKFAVIEEEGGYRIAAHSVESETP